MRTEHYKQVAVISETTPEAFENKLNAVLAGITSPEIVFDQSRSFTATIIYKVRKDVPESLIELLELMDNDGEHHTCNECPYLQRSKDKRKKWLVCTHSQGKTQATSRACEAFYMWRLARYKELVEEYKKMPYEIE